MTTDPTPESARALLYRHGLPEDVIDGVLCLHAQELAALQRLRMDELDLTGQKARIVGRIVDLIDPTRTAPAGIGVSATPSHTDQTERRARYAAAIYEHMHPGSYWSDTSMPADWRPTYLEEADAVMAVADAEQAELRRLADEAQQQPTDRDVVEAHDAALSFTLKADAAQQQEPSVHGESVAHLAGDHDNEPAADAQQPDGAHVCKPGASRYYCPTSGQTESDCHGGFNICCDRPDLHEPAVDARQDGAPS